MTGKYARLVAVMAIGGTLAVACSDGANDDTAAPAATSSSAGVATSAADSPMTDHNSTSPTEGSKSATDESMTTVVGSDTPAAELRAGLTALLQEHVYLAGITTGTALNPAAGPESAAFMSAAGTLDANSVALSKSIEGVYGAQAGEQFLALWRKHIGFFVDYTLGAAGKDKAMQDKAVADLDGYRADFGAFLASANPNLTKEAVADELKPHVASLAAAVDAQAAGSPDSVGTLQESAAHMPMTAKILAGAIAQQFADKFPA